jgi:hypothetical protein
MTFPQPRAPIVKGVDHSSPEDCRRSKLGRIDFPGSITLALANVSLLLFLDQLQANPDNLGRDPATMVPMSTWLGSLLVFLLVEGLWAKEPIIPLRLLVKRNVVSSYAIQFLQTGAQMAVRLSHLPLTISTADVSQSCTRLCHCTLGSQWVT